MSDFSVLSHEYQHASDLSGSLNKALLVLKKISLQLPGAGIISPIQSEQSRRVIHDLLLEVLELLNPPNPQAINTHASIVIPGSLVTRLRVGDSDPQALVGRLRKIATLLADESMAVPREDLEVLDHLAAAVDAVRSGVFKQMSRR